MLMVDVVQLVERQIVVLVVAGSSPTTHPSKKSAKLMADFFITYNTFKLLTFGVSMI